MFWSQVTGWWGGGEMVGGEGMVGKGFVIGVYMAMLNGYAIFT
jgi:hypothetical protein